MTLSVPKDVLSPASPPMSEPLVVKGYRDHPLFDIKFGPVSRGICSYSRVRHATDVDNAGLPYDERLPFTASWGVNIMVRDNDTNRNGIPVRSFVTPEILRSFHLPPAIIGEVQTLREMVDTLASIDYKYFQNGVEIPGRTRMLDSFSSADPLSDNHLLAQYKQDYNNALERFRRSPAHGM